MYQGGVCDHQRRRVSSLEIMVYVPKVNGVISSSSCERKRLHHGANCSQPVGFSRYNRSAIRSNLTSLGGMSVSRHSLAGEG